jgi:hypothetical protein
MYQYNSSHPSSKQSYLIWIRRMIYCGMTRFLASLYISKYNTPNISCILNKLWIIARYMHSLKIWLFVKNLKNHIGQFVLVLSTYMSVCLFVSPSVRLYVCLSEQNINVSPYIFIPYVDVSEYLYIVLTWYWHIDKHYLTNKAKFINLIKFTTTS